MKIKELEYSRTFNLGQYESERISLRVELDETDDFDQIFKKIKTRVFQLREENNIQSIDIQKIKSALSNEWVDRLEILEDGSFFIVKTKKHLNYDEFRELRSILLNLGGKYVSAGKNSHFKIPFKKK